MGKELRVPGSVALDLVMRAQGVLETAAKMADAREFWPAVSKALRQALGMLVKMRQREGEQLRRDLCGRIAILRKAVAQVQRQAPLVQTRYREQLIERIKSAGLAELGIEEDRLVKEVVYFADRSDISEELTRLKSHFQQFTVGPRWKRPSGAPPAFSAKVLTDTSTPTASTPRTTDTRRHAPPPTRVSE